MWDEKEKSECGEASVCVKLGRKARRENHVLHLIVTTERLENVRMQLRNFRKVKMKMMILQHIPYLMRADLASAPLQRLLFASYEITIFCSLRPNSQLSEFLKLQLNNRRENENNRDFLIRKPSNLRSSDRCVIPERGFESTLTRLRRGDKSSMVKYLSSSIMSRIMSEVRL